MTTRASRGCWSTDTSQTYPMPVYLESCAASGAHGNGERAAKPSRSQRRHGSKGMIKVPQRERTDQSVVMEVLIIRCHNLQCAFDPRLSLRVLRSRRPARAAATDSPTDEGQYQHRARRSALHVVQPAIAVGTGQEGRRGVGGIHDAPLHTDDDGVYCWRRPASKHFGARKVATPRGVRQCRFGLFAAISIDTDRASDAAPLERLPAHAPCVSPPPPRRVDLVPGDRPQSHGGDDRMHTRKEERGRPEARVARGEGLIFLLVEAFRRGWPRPAERPKSRAAQGRS